MKQKYLTTLSFEAKGHCRIEDDMGNVLLDKDNAVHPQNMARAISRALSNESNFHVHRIAFGNGGTDIDAAYNVTFKTPNDGQLPDTQTWDSRLYNETYSEIIDESSISLGTDPGSADARVGTRAGGGAVPDSDEESTISSGPGVRSRSLGLTSEVVIEVQLNPDEPTGQLANDQTTTNIEDGSFTFDEIGLYTTGAPARDSAGYQDIDVDNKTSTDQTPLLKNTTYDFKITVDDGTEVTIEFTVPTAVGDFPTYGEVCEAINTVDTAWMVSQALPSGATVAITDVTFGTYPTIEGQQTFGYLRFTSNSVGSTSSISLATGDTNDLFTALNGTIVQPAVNGVDKGVQDNVADPDTEQERLLTHLIFTPILKAANRTLKITYTLSISVARTST